jgi:hypothetical protein
MSLSTAQLKAALATAQTTYATALNSFIGALIDVESLTEAVESCGGGQQIALSRMARDRLHELPLELEHPIAAPRANVSASLKATGSTTTSSPTLTVASVPGWVAAGMAVTVSNAAGTVIGTVASAVPASTSVTCAANVTVAVAVGDVLTYSLRGASHLGDHVRRSTAAYTGQWSGS